MHQVGRQMHQQRNRERRHGWNRDENAQLALDWEVGKPTKQSPSLSARYWMIDLTPRCRLGPRILLVWSVTDVTLRPELARGFGRNPR
jgi:hypothetical protein